MAGAEPYVQAGPNNQDSRPIPDPTDLTRQAVDALRKELTDIFDVKLGAEIDLTAERFRAVNDQITVERELRKEQKTDRKVELDAALSAAKDLSAQQAANFAADTAKTEDRFDKALVAQGLTASTAITGLVRELNDVKERLTRAEARKEGGTEERTEHRDKNSYNVGIVGGILGIIVTLAVLLPILIAIKP